MKLPRLTGRELCKMVEKLGFQKIRHVGSHARYAHQDGRKTTIPLHSNEELGPGLILEILSQKKNNKKRI